MGKKKKCKKCKKTKAKYSKYVLDTLAIIRERERKQIYGW